MYFPQTLCSLNKVNEKNNEIWLLIYTSFIYPSFKINCIYNFKLRKISEAVAQLNLKEKQKLGFGRNHG